MPSSLLFDHLSWSARLTLAATLALLAACAASPDADPSGRCDDRSLGWAIGQPLDEANFKRLSRESGAGLVNPVAPTNLLRRDSRQDRLRVYIDTDNRITAARCE
jgi:hypothetical protein